MGYDSKTFENHEKINFHNLRFIDSRTDIFKDATDQWLHK